MSRGRFGFNSTTTILSYIKFISLQAIKFFGGKRDMSLKHNGDLGDIVSTGHISSSFADSKNAMPKRMPPSPLSGTAVMICMRSSPKTRRWGCDHGKVFVLNCGKESNCKSHKKMAIEKPEEYRVGLDGSTLLGTNIILYPL